MHYRDAVTRLTAAFAEPLPGPAAQMRMAPRPRKDWPPGFDLDHRRHAAGLVLVFPVDGEAHTVLTVRSPHVRHSGQVSLPGGVVEPGETFEHTALREAREEIALDVTDVHVLGALTPIDIPVSGFRLHPIVATLDVRPVMAPHDREVARIAEVPISTLLLQSTVAWREMTRGGYTVDAPSFIVDDLVVWGATAMVLAEFLSLLGWIVELQS